ncbi:recombination-associated protein RdgC [Entomomonas asaccharolytica]|uniref:Recombination-associated protein RdgC n=1 Tax=Entomomonas asaccharolytica TaxID=2785331 RepID=A0A974NHB1_9GAMM|nr:recombination-associated protein RdgC [Entomomonas asaccharolytica]QQP86562.1 recombination-associated protein RdgC [Entomomonas asaccharolytica]
MWFRNLLVYRLTQQISFTEEELIKALQTKLAKPCTFQELSTFGFIAPFGKGEDAPLTHISQDFYLIAARKEERILPASVIKEALQEKVDEIEARDARKVYKKEKDQLKDEIVQDLLPRAFSRKKVIYAAIAPKLGLILVDSTSTSKAEELLSTLREALGSLPIRPVTVKVAPSATLTDWIKTQKSAQGFQVLEDCELRDTHEDGGVVRCKRQDLTSEEIQIHLKSGKVVTQLALAWQDKLSFILDDKFAIKRIKFEDLLLEEADKVGGDDAVSQFDATFTLMMLTFAEFLPALLQALGGEELPQSI